MHKPDTDRQTRPYNHAHTLQILRIKRFIKSNCIKCEYLKSNYCDGYRLSCSEILFSGAQLPGHTKSHTRTL